MKKLIVVYVIIIVAVILLAVFRFGGNLPSLPFLGGGSQAEINGNTIRLVLAKSEEEKMKGLSGREKLDENQGMLFIFEEKDRYGFWMKEMRFAIDIIYLDDNRVVYIIENVPAPRGQADALTIYTPDQPANRVLELNAGKARELEIQEGSEITFRGI